MGVYGYDGTGKISARLLELYIVDCANIDSSVKKFLFILQKLYRLWTVLITFWFETLLILGILGNGSQNLLKLLNSDEKIYLKNIPC